MSTGADSTLQGMRLSPEQLKEMSERRNPPGLLRAGTHYAAIGAMGFLIWLIQARFGIPYAIPLLFVQGYLIAFLFTAVHECAHKTAFESRFLSLFVGHVSAFLVILPYENY
jgi:fatty acid desaturase